MKTPFQQFVDWSGGLIPASSILGITPGGVGHVYRGIRGVSREMAERVELASAGRWKRHHVMWPELAPRAKKRNRRRPG